MNKRPLAVTGIACLVIAAGIVGAAMHVCELVTGKLFRWEDLWGPAVRFSSRDLRRFHSARP